ncbi:enoyl-CoA hydratase [Mesorhizobium sp. LNHC221B00]|uniref:enoyl-CoA hydratase-related protein n=1 Tax=Mesorhizobium sp. LNHC221B00 TaxID=1287233 RepID=UPI0003CF295C|nr:enoyl-CoA hydratase-related protein [Mesorhizobium sp. LNHC221B00]ESY79358.1 enoyl-CoA hydratase [Mesorhizobium sp. LNHC221B00]
MTDLPKLIDSKLEVSDRVAMLILDRDDVRNELTGTALIDDIVRTVDWINGGAAVSALIVTGAGKAFSAGGNVKDMRDRRGSFAGEVYEVQDRYRRGIQQIALAMHRLEVPAIAAVNGAAIGAGFDLATMCDIRIGAENAVFGATFINLGIVPGDGGAWFLQDLLGPQRAAELIFTGRLMSAGEALRLGVVLEVAAASELRANALQLAGSIAEKPPQALRLAKRLLKAAQRLDLPDYLDLCAAFQGMCHNTLDHLEAVEAFLDKRPARFQGH